MLVLFGLGRPGSGKSTAARRITSLVQKIGWNTTRIKDYEILYEWFLADTTQNRFRPADYSGFDVLDFSVLDEVLVEVQRQTLKRKSSVTENELVIIEFARDDYGEALQRFDPGLLKDAYFLFIEAEVETCIQRIHERIKEPDRFDNHFISDEIVRGYYGKDNIPYMKQGIQEDFGIEHQRVKAVYNNGSKEQFVLEVDQFIESILPGTLTAASK
ncbi:MAG: hypothetical protein JOZ18_16100 [Chloroflexi bacterium]|nr:hypothetical protein [Chloroflexota bacterium]